MRAKLVAAIETGAELIASMVMAGAVAFAFDATLKWSVPLPQLRLIEAAAGSAAFLLGGMAMRAARLMPTSYGIPVFDLRELDFEELAVTKDEPSVHEELLLTEADRFDHQDPASDPLLLDDVLAEMGPDSRVVRLFDRAAMPTAGQLQSRIEKHLAHGTSAAAGGDASRALSEALAELRRSLR